MRLDPSPGESGCASLERLRVEDCRETLCGAIIGDPRKVGSVSCSGRLSKDETDTVLIRCIEGTLGRLGLLGGRLETALGLPEEDEVPACDFRGGLR